DEARNFASQNRVVGHVLRLRYVGLIKICLVTISHIFWKNRSFGCGFLQKGNGFVTVQRRSHKRFSALSSAHFRLDFS
ncbi:MAG: hypothetical protein NC203_10115, partial [Firmicutes bacterium]|nr:hypothetical protein [[Eubacterium] siraeum]MCM1488707.1 hypothetical protein [Bacillota bacterium]